MINCAKFTFEYFAFVFAGFCKNEIQKRDDIQMVLRLVSTSFYFAFQGLFAEDDLRRSVDSHVEDRMVEYTYPSSSSSSDDSGGFGISSGIKFLVANFAILSRSVARASVAWHARRIYNGCIVPIIVVKERSAFDSSKLR